MRKAWSPPLPSIELADQIHEYGERHCLVIQSPASGRVLVTGARYMPESEPVAAFGDTSFPTVTQPDNASARHAEMITLFIVFPPCF